MKATGFLTVALLLFTVGISAGRQLQQGIPVHTIDPWGDGITYPDVKLPVNGAVKFHWTELHGVWRIPSGSCPFTFTFGNNLAELGPTSPSGSFTTLPLAAGTYWYSCPVPGHCASGQIVKVIVG